MKTMKRGRMLILFVAILALTFVPFTPMLASAADDLFAPLSAVFQPKSGTPDYRADGSVTITMEAENVPSYYRVKWGNANGALDGYQPFDDVSATGTSTVFNLPSNAVIPAEADRLLVYSVSSGVESELYAEATLAGKSGEMGKPLSEFQIASDIHIKSNANETYNQNFAKLLNQIKQISPNSNGLFVVGDITNGDDVDPKYVDLVPEQYTNLNNIITNSGFNKNKIYLTAGNHEFFCKGDLGISASRDAQCIAQFLNGTNTLGFSSDSTRATGTTADKMYYYVDIAGSRFIMLSGLECRNNNAAYLGQTQRNWLASTLASAPAGPVYVFLHQGLKDTVAGTHGLTGTLPVSTEDETFIRNQLANYPRAIYFSGHSHADLGADSLYVSNGLTAVNTASVAYTDSQGSEAWFVSVYEDAIVFKGRDLKNGQWISSAQLVVARNTPHSHDMEHVPAQPVQGSVDGNIEHWHCRDCDRYYTSATPTANDRVYQSETVLPATPTESNPEIPNVPNTDDGEKDKNDGDTGTALGLGIGLGVAGAIVVGTAAVSIVIVKKYKKKSE